jgi:hypothetical protein
VFFPELTEQYGKIPEKRKLCAENGKMKKGGASIKTQYLGTSACFSSPYVFVVLKNQLAYFLHFIRAVIRVYGHSNYPK